MRQDSSRLALDPDAYFVLENIFYKEGNSIILDKLSIKIVKNSTVGIIGRSGTGKTSILRIISGFVRNYEGKVFLEGNLINSLSIYDRNFRTSIDGNSVLDDCTVEYNILLGVRSGGLQTYSLEELAYKLHLQDILKLKANIISESKKQMVSLARAFISESNLIMLDNPLLRLDEYDKLVAMRFLEEAKKQRTIIFTTSDVSDLDFLADYTLIMENKSYFFQPYKEAISSPKSLIAAEMLGYIKVYAPNIYCIQAEESIECFEQQELEAKFLFKISKSCVSILRDSDCEESIIFYVYPLDIDLQPVDSEEQQINTLYVKVGSRTNIQTLLIAENSNNLVIKAPGPLSLGRIQLNQRFKLTINKAIMFIK